MLKPEPVETREEADVTVLREGASELALDHPLDFFYLAAPQPCPYLPNRTERKIVARLGGKDVEARHERLTRAGFRRTRDFVYRPACPGCNACVPVRVLAKEFRPSRSLRRIERANRDLSWNELPPVARYEHYSLFTRYLEARHKGGEMTGMDFADYGSMIEETPIETRVVEFRDPEARLLAVCLTDFLSDGLSGIYKFFEPSEAKRSLGTFIILWHIRRARALGLSYVYLGYWIADCRKMAYKDRFRPFETFGPEGWRRRDVTLRQVRAAEPEGAIPA
ncbi:MAG: arginyltransferase [Proteobacteria bacterium]|nr:arginyltransferase [Pseudomonadota bacterium]